MFLFLSLKRSETLKMSRFLIITHCLNILHYRRKFQNPMMLISPMMMMMIMTPTIFLKQMMMLMSPMMSRMMFQMMSRMRKTSQILFQYQMM